MGVHPDVVAARKGACTDTLVSNAIQAGPNSLLYTRGIPLREVCDSYAPAVQKLRFQRDGRESRYEQLAFPDSLMKPMVDNVHEEDGGCDIVGSHFDFTFHACLFHARWVLAC